jgi:hypothetical protein
MAKGLFKKIFKGILIGGGTLLSILSPAVGGAMITRGMAIGAGAVAAGSMIKADLNVPSIDQVTQNTTGMLAGLGFLEAADVPTSSGPSRGLVLTPVVKMVLLFLAGVFIFVIFRKKR